MSHWIRWEYVVPRLLAAVVAVLALQYGLCLVVRAVVVLGGQSATGAKVEVAHARVSLLGGVVELHDLRMANPRAPLQNLLQFDRAALDLETSSLLHKRTVIHSGRVSGLRFATPRDTSGELPVGACAKNSVVLDWLGDQTAAIAEAWLEQLAEKFEQDVLNQLESVRLTEDLLARWPKQHQALEKRVKQLKDRGVELQATYADAQANPLRHVDFLKRLPKDIVALQKEFVSLANEIEKLPALVDADRRAIVSARKHDEMLIRKHLRVDAIDSGMLTAYFLHDHLNGPIGEFVSWVRWVQDAANADPELPKNQRLGGEDILFAGVERHPDLLIRSLELEGTASVGGQALALQGSLRNLSSAPALQDQPTRLFLAATGPASWQLEATIDRTGSASGDEFVFACRDFPFPAASWGTSDKLRLAVAPSIATIDVRLRVDAGRLSGNVQIMQNQLQLTPSLGDSLKAVPVAGALQTTLEEIDSLSVRMTVSGTIDEPRCEMSSNLGPAAADAMLIALEQVAGQQAATMLAKSRQHVDEQLAGLERRIAERQSALLQPLEGSTRLLQKIVSDHKASSQLSTERIGRQLPAGSLFR